MSQKEYDNELKGVLFVNDDKKNDRHPDYKGSATIEGQDYWVSAWIKEPRSGGAKFLSMAFTAKDDNTQQGRAVNRQTNDAKDFLTRNQDKIDAHRPNAPKPRPAQDYDSFDDDIPF